MKGMKCLRRKASPTPSPHGKRRSIKSIRAINGVVTVDVAVAVQIAKLCLVNVK